MSNIGRVRPSEVIVYTDDRLFDAIAEQLKTPLLQISQHIELARRGATPQLEHVETVADMALQLIENYQMSRQFSAEQLAMQLEPISVSLALHTAAERLTSIAREYGCELQLDIKGKHGPIMAHRPSLEAAMTSLGYSFIEAQQKGTKRPELILAAHRSRSGIVLGVYSNQDELTTDMFRRAKYLYGRAKQTVPTLGHTPTAGVFVADSLFQNMATKLAVARHSKLTGLAATLQLSPQLQLV